MSDDRLLSVEDIARMWEMPFRDVWLGEAKGLISATRADGTVDPERDASQMSFREFMAWSDGPNEDWSWEDVEAWVSDARVQDFPDWKPTRSDAAATG